MKWKCFPSMGLNLRGTHLVFLHWLRIFHLKSLLLKRKRVSQWSRVLGGLCLLTRILCTGVTWCYMPWRVESRLGAWVSKKQRKHLDLSYRWYLQTCQQPGQKWEFPYRTGARYRMKKVAESSCQLPCAGWLRLLGELGHSVRNFHRHFWTEKRKKKRRAPMPLSSRAQKLLL